MLLDVPNNPLSPVSYNSISPDGSDVHSTTGIHVDLQDPLSSSGRGTVAVRECLDYLREILAGGLAAPAALINRWDDNGIDLIASKPVF